MFTDMVGYTALTQRNEAEAMEVLSRHNRVLRPIFQEHRGREVKTIGDAFLVEFGSALDAVRCAVQVQETIHKLDHTFADQSKLKLRIGIHLGDVIHSGTDVLGDAVNIASRIQPLAEPGGLCVSGEVYSQVRNKVHYEFLKAEKVTLKNVSYPVDVYHIVLPWEPRPKVPLHPQESDGVPLTRRLAILPLVNLTQDSGDEYFAEGMTEELINAISNVRDLRVIARTSVMRYKGTTEGISQIARELKVGSIVEGSVRKVGTKIRVAIKVVDGVTEEHLLAKNYDREMEDIFVVQSDIAKQVSRIVKAKIRAIEKERIEKKPTHNIDAYSLYLKGRFIMHKRTKESIEEAAKLFLQATLEDDRYANAYAGVADAYLLLGSYGYLQAKQAFGKAKEYISKALDLEEELAESHVSLGFLLETYYYDFVSARKEFERAISLSPSYAQARHWYGLNLAIFGQFDGAAAQLEMALEADPLSAQLSTVLGGLYVYLGRDDDALMQWRKALVSSPDNVPVYLNRAMFYAKAGKREEALADMRRAMELTSGAVVAKCILAYVHVALGDREAARGLLLEVTTLSQKEYVPPWFIAIVHAALGEKDEFFEWAERAVEDRSAEVESLVNPDAMFAPITSDQRYRRLLDKVGVPSNLGPRQIAAPGP
ncbi:MAG: tetratricopeptide repeat protein [Thaumarchaeota archaeon]|nr:tetratricopeptide repeat protein [Nitrososphaerota archaeon]